jgi:hypothetical protein
MICDMKNRHRLLIAVIAASIPLVAVFAWAAFLPPHQPAAARPSAAVLHWDDLVALLQSEIPDLHRVYPHPSPGKKGEDIRVFVRRQFETVYFKVVGGDDEPAPGVFRWRNYDIYPADYDRDNPRLELFEKIKAILSRIE